MRIFFIRRKLWQIVMVDITKQIKNTPKKDDTSSDTSKLIVDDAG